MSNFPDARLARAVRRAPWFVFPDQPERGTTYWDWSLTPVKDSGGGVHGLVFSLRETTRYKQVELGLRESRVRSASAPSRTTRRTASHVSIASDVFCSRTPSPPDILVIEDNQTAQPGAARRAVDGAAEA